MINTLLHTIEQRTGLCMRSNRDFTELSRLIFDTMHESLSPSTLKRLWGYVAQQNMQPRATTLNILAQYAGFSDFESFKKFYNIEHPNEQNSCASEISFAPYWDAAQLPNGELVAMRWHPNRLCIVRHLVNVCFEVVKAENCKISVGDTFCCDFFVDGEALYVYNLTHGGKTGLSYVAGKNGGVKFEIPPLKALCNTKK